MQRGMDFDKPMLIIWCNHSIMVVMLPVQLLHYHFISRRADPTLPDTWHRHLHENHGIEVWPLIRTLGLLSIVFVFADYCWYLAIGHTLVSVGTCIYNAQCVFAYVLSIPLLGESVLISKVGGVAVALAGVIIVAFVSSASSDSSSSKHMTSGEQFDGNILALCSALGYAIYEVLFARYATSTSSTAVINWCTGVVGLVSLLTGWLFVLVVNFLPSGTNSDTKGFGRWFGEPFEVPDGKEAAMLLINSLLALVFNVLFMLALVLTSPIIVATAGMVAIPACAIADWVIYGYSISWKSVIGFGLILVGFACLTYTDFLKPVTPDADDAHSKGDDHADPLLDTSVGDVEDTELPPYDEKDYTPHQK